MILLIPLIASADEPVEIKKTSLDNTTRISPKPLLDLIEEQLKLFRTLKIEEAYNYTTKEFRQKTSLDDYKRLVAKYKALSQNNLFKFESFHIEKDIATISGELHSKDGEVVPVEFDFVMDNGKWKIMGIQIYKNEMPSPVNKN